MDHPVIQRLDRSDPRVAVAAESEARLFAHYGLATRELNVATRDLGLRLRVVEVGTGTPLVLVPGGSGELFQWIPLMAELTGYRLIAVDLPGGGLSDAVDHRRVDMRRLASETLSSVLDATGLSSASFVTNSRGAQWTLWFAMDSPARVTTMVHTGCPALVLGTAAPLPMRLMSVPGLNRLLFALAGHPRSRKQAEGVLQMLGTGPEALKALPDVFFETLLPMFNLPAYRGSWLSFLETMLTLSGSNPRYQIHEAELQAIEQPVHMIWGRRDPFGDLDIGHRVATALPHGNLLEMDAGHIPWFDDPVECARLVRQALA